MRAPVDYRGTWKKGRYDWKRRLRRCQSLNSGAKHFAVQMCDSYANSVTACCWPSNETLMAEFGLDKRTIQRHIKSLIEAGWMIRVRMKRRRRALQLVFPATVQDDTKHDTDRTGRVTAASFKHDSPVAPYIEPKMNQRREGSTAPKGRAMRYVKVAREDFTQLQEWHQWISENIDYDPDALLALVNKGNHFYLPQRYPSRDRDVMQTQIAYFQWVIKTQGTAF